MQNEVLILIKLVWSVAAKRFQGQRVHRNCIFSDAAVIKLSEGLVQFHTVKIFFPNHTGKVLQAQAAAGSSSNI